MGYVFVTTNVSEVSQKARVEKRISDLSMQRFRTNPTGRLRSRTKRSMWRNTRSCETSWWSRLLLSPTKGYPSCTPSTDRWMRSSTDWCSAATECSAERFHLTYRFAAQRSSSLCVDRRLENKNAIKIIWISTPELLQYSDRLDAKIAAHGTLEPCVE